MPDKLIPFEDSRSSQGRCQAPARSMKAGAATSPALLRSSLIALVLCGSAAAQTAGTYLVTNIVSDGSVPAITMDPGFINALGQRQWTGVLDQR